MTTCFVIVAVLNSFFAVMAGSIFRDVKGSWMDLTLCLSFAFTAGVAVATLWGM